MNFSHSDKVEDLHARVHAFMRDRILPANREWRDIARQGRVPMEVVEPLMHKRVVARHELKHAKAGLGRAADYLASFTVAS